MCEITENIILTQSGALQRGCFLVDFYCFCFCFVCCFGVLISQHPSLRYVWYSSASVIVREAEEMMTEEEEVEGVREGYRGREIEGRSYKRR